MLAIVSLILGSPALADKPVKVDKSVKADSATDSHGYDMRMENANRDSGKASWKTGDSTGNDDNTGGDNTGDNTDPSGCIYSGQIIVHSDGWHCDVLSLSICQLIKRLTAKPPGVFFWDFPK